MVVSSAAIINSVFHKDRRSTQVSSRLALISGSGRTPRAGNVVGRPLPLLLPPLLVPPPLEADRLLVATVCDAALVVAAGVTGTAVGVTGVAVVVPRMVIVTAGEVSDGPWAKLIVAVLLIVEFAAAWLLIVTVKVMVTLPLGATVPKS